MKTPLEIIKDFEEAGDMHSMNFIKSQILALLKALRAELEGRTLGSHRNEIENAYGAGHDQALQDQVENLDKLIKEI